MRKVLPLLVLATGLAASCFAQDEDTIEWLDNYTEAMAEAKRTGKNRTCIG